MLFKRIRASVREERGASTPKVASFFCAVEQDMGHVSGVLKAAVQLLAVWKLRIRGLTPRRSATSCHASNGTNNTGSRTGESFSKSPSVSVHSLFWASHHSAPASHPQPNHPGSLLTGSPSTDSDLTDDILNPSSLLAFQVQTSAGSLSDPQISVSSVRAAVSSPITAAPHGNEFASMLNKDHVSQPDEPFALESRVLPQQGADGARKEGEEGWGVQESQRPVLQPHVSEEQLALFDCLFPACLAGVEDEGFKRASSKEQEADWGEVFSRERERENLEAKRPCSQVQSFFSRSVPSFGPEDFFGTLIPLDTTCYVQHITDCLLRGCSSQPSSLYHTASLSGDQEGDMNVFLQDGVAPPGPDVCMGHDEAAEDSALLTPFQPPAPEGKGHDWENTTLPGTSCSGRSFSSPARQGPVSGRSGAGREMGGAALEQFWHSSARISGGAAVTSMGPPCDARSIRFAVQRLQKSSLRQRGPYSASAMARPRSVPYGLLCHTGSGPLYQLPEESEL